MQFTASTAVGCKNCMEQEDLENGGSSMES